MSMFMIRLARMAKEVDGLLNDWGFDEEYSFGAALTHAICLAIVKHMGAL